MGSGRDLRNRKVFIVVISFVIITSLIASYVLFTHGHMRSRNTSGSTTQSPGIPPTQPSITTSNPSQISVNSLSKTGFSYPVNELTVPVINGCLDIPETYRYRCLNSIEGLIGEYGFKYNLSRQSSFNVYQAILDYNRSPVDYILSLRDKDNSIMLSLKNGQPYSIFKVYTWSEFNKIVEGFNPDKYRTYNVTYLEELLYNTSNINLSLYGDPYLVSRELFRNIETQAHGSVDEISYTIGFRIKGYDVLVASSLPYFKLNAYLFIQYNERYVIVGFKWNQNPPVRRNHIVEGKECDMNLTKALASILKTNVKQTNILESKKIFFIKPLTKDFYYVEGKLIKVSVNSSSGRYVVLILLDLSNCEIYNYVAARL